MFFLLGMMEVGWSACETRSAEGKIAEAEWITFDSGEKGTTNPDSGATQAGPLNPSDATVAGSNQDAQNGAVLQLLPDEVREEYKEAERKREAAVAAFEANSESEEAQLALVSAYFPSVGVGSTNPILAKAPSRAPASAGSFRRTGKPLKVTLPGSSDGTFTIESRGHSVQVRAPGADGAAGRAASGAAFYGKGHVFAFRGADAGIEKTVETDRVEEFFVLPGGAKTHVSNLELSVSNGIVAVRNAEDYLEFLDEKDVPIMRLHYSVAVDRNGERRRSEVKLQGVGDTGSGRRYALLGATLNVSMPIDLEGLVPPVVIDPGWSSTGSMAMPRRRHTSTLWPSSGKVLVTGGDLAGGGQLASADLFDEGIAPPVNQPPVADAGVARAFECGSPASLDGSASSDPDSTAGTNDDIVSFEWFEGTTLIATGETATATLPLGSHTITLKVTDKGGLSDTDDVVVTVQDTTAPTLSVSLSPSELWPPDHKMVPITVTPAVSDACDANPTVVLGTATSNEPDNGLGDGDTENDIQTAAGLQLRAERSGTGTGRIYTITYQVTDASGNSVTATAMVTVPHDQGGGSSSGSGGSPGGGPPGGNPGTGQGKGNK